MDPITLLRDPAKLEGTCYIELLPGGYHESCWNPGSVFLTEEVFGYIEPMVERHEPRFDHFAFVDIERDTWTRILEDLAVQADALRSARSPAQLSPEPLFFYPGTRDAFTADFRANATRLADLIDELGTWIREQLRTHEVIAVLGM